MNVLVFGGGAVGSGLASCIMASGVDVDIIAREATCDLLNTDGLIKTGIRGEKIYPPELLKAFSDITLIDREHPYDFILVCTKSNDSYNAASIIAGATTLYDKNTAIVLCQNGWGNREIFSEFFPSEQVYSARVITGFRRHEPNHVEITVHVQPISMGSFENAAASCLEPLRAAIDNGGLSCEITDSIEKDLWAKMLFNCSLNPLGAVFGVPYGLLKESGHTLEIIHDVVHEVFGVIHASGHSTHWDSADDYYIFLTETLIPGAATHESSTLQDIKSNKKTEIDALTGQVVKLGDRYGVPVPVNRMLYRMIRFMETEQD